MTTLLSDKQAVKLGKLLSLVLRHKPEVLGITLDQQGWTDVATLLEKLGVSFEVLKYVVDTNSKKRFAFNEDFSRIRASQGHSLNVLLDYMPQTPPEQLYHGTAERFIDAIRRQGLLKMQRQHVHLSPDRDTAIQVGQRHGKPVVLTIQAQRMHQEGFPFYQSANGVWLTAHVPPDYIGF